MTGKDLNTKVTEWLEGQGYPLEMRVAREFRRARFKVIQSDYYEDMTSGEQREIDVVAHVDGEPVENTTLRVAAVIECKMSRDKPWVFFSAKTRIHPNASIAQRTGSAVGSAFLRLIASDEDVHNLPLFALPDQTAYGVTQAFTSGKDAAYEACMAVANASVAFAREVDGASKSPRRQARVVIPVVVVDGRFFQASLGQSDELVVEEVVQSVLAWRNPIGSVAHTFIHFVTFASLASFVTDVLATGLGLFEKRVALAEARKRTNNA